MSTGGVEFDQDQFGLEQKRAHNTLQYSQGGEKGLVGWLMRHGIAKSTKSAQFIQIGIIAINLAITFYVISLVV